MFFFFANTVSYSFATSKNQERGSEYDSYIHTNKLYVNILLSQRTNLFRSLRGKTTRLSATVIEYNLYANNSWSVFKKYIIQKIKISPRDTPVLGLHLFDSTYSHVY